MDSAATAASNLAGAKRKRTASPFTHLVRERLPALKPFARDPSPSNAMKPPTPSFLTPLSLATATPSFGTDQQLPGAPSSAVPSTSTSSHIHDPSLTHGSENCQHPDGAHHTGADPFQCSWEDFAKECGVTAVPCNNPNCEDVSPCPATLDQCTDPLKCLGNICYDQECAPTEQEGEFWCHEQCDEATSCASPCFSDECGVPACSEPCIEPTQPTVADGLGRPPPLPPGHQLRQHDVLCQSQDCAIPAFECVDPRCISTVDDGSIYPHFHHELRKFLDDCAAEDAFNNTQTSKQPQGSDPFAMSLGAHGNLSMSPDVQMQRARASAVIDPMERIMDFNQRPYGSVSSADAYWNPSSAPLPELSNSLTATPKSTDTSDIRTTISRSPAQAHQYMCMWAADSESLSSRPCGQIFRDAADLHSHVERAHIDSLQREVSGAIVHGYWCRWEGCARNQHGNPATSFAARPKLKRHIQTHTLYKPFICDTCGVSMKTKDAMEKHLRTHTGERPYRCPLANCAKIFATSTELKTHMVVHSGKKPHECPICGESFADSSNLSKHKKTHFLGMYRCPEAGCGARMKRWDQMRRHIVSQGHSKHLLEDMDAQREYKARMEREWKELPDEQKMLTDSREAGAA